ncbi:DegT/DnrJ/EryC1/StrS family aminotransferase [Rheinheimera sp. WS51]|uniref:DegT/DnrJ/EryC1/StrS family aminotransferase n=1 Tax=Rheinheimera sp. WS51 TaxID=3425886 RepID=UPI003D8FA344
MDVKFAPVMANASHFPAAIIKAAPAFSLTDFRQFGQSTDFSHCIYTRNGRGAIGLAAQQLMQQNKTNIVLLPAYHCPALVEPFLWLGYEIRFYPVLPDLTVDKAIFSQLLTADVSHCLVVNFFGFKQNNSCLIEMAAQAGKLVIEDCAHALVDFFQQLEMPNPAVTARICSINKILPSIDGGLLYMKQAINATPKYCSWFEEVKGIAFLLKIPQLIQYLKPKKQQALTVSDVNAPIQKQFNYFQPADLDSASFRHTKLIVSSSNLKKIQARRIENYNYLATALTNTGAGQCLYAYADFETPYVLPFLLDDAADFQQLRMQKIQVLRWEEVAYSACKVSEDYRSRLIQLPCHHKLKKTELDTIINAVKGLVNNK